MNIERILEHLGELVACDSQNPPREITADSTMFPYIRDVLADRFDVDVVDHGSGHVALLAVRGAPELLFNCHLDTVPIGDGWRVPPLELTVRDGKAWGRGTCDIKGAAAALLAEAKARALAMADNYAPPTAESLHLPGLTGRTALALAVAYSASVSSC